MAIWAIPSDKIIDWSKNGDDVDAFAQKTKYCLEAAFEALAELHTAVNKIANIPVSIDNIQDGEILAYHAATQSFRNETKGAVGEGQSLVITNGDTLVGDYNGGSPITINLQNVINESTTGQDVAHLIRLVNNLYLVLKVAELDPGGYDGLKCFTFYGNLDDLASSTATISDGKIICNGLGQIVVTRPISLGVECSRANLVVKHQNFADVTITAEIALDEGEFVTMTKAGTYPDSGNPNRATTQFTYSGEAGTLATLRLTFSREGGASFSVDSFACTFNE